MKVKKRFWLRIEEVLGEIRDGLTGNVVRATVTYATLNSTVLFTVPAGKTARWSLANVGEVWDGVGATFDIGWALDTDGIFNDVDLTVLGPVASGTPHHFTTETQVIVTTNHAASVQGEAEVIMEYV